MRKVIVACSISLDDVMQSPGAPDEDPYVREGGLRTATWRTE